MKATFRYPGGKRLVVKFRAGQDNKTLALKIAGVAEHKGVALHKIR